MAEAANLLGHETSPYLLQHAQNPVHWRPWGKAALEEARAESKPILLSIGYAACHWCHVMAHESFEDADTAAAMNNLFVNIKVDREERPDIDHLYMSALQAIGEPGGWPLTMFLAADGTPFWGGTYFPPTPRWGKPSFRQVLQAVATAWAAQDDMVAKNGATLRRALDQMARATPGDLPGPAQLDKAAGVLLSLTDPDQGGMKGAPKFPNAPIFRFLWQNAYRTGQDPGRDALHLLLRRMSQGGIYDHLGGGYARYATDAIWLVPHFEKMLYDNAQLLELLALAHADQAVPLYEARAAETVGWMLRDMTAANGAFAASEDADSEGEEGRFYVWTEAEVDRVLGADAPAFKAAYDVTPHGNWEGKTILQRLASQGTAEQEQALARARNRLFEVRSQRVRPGRDDKVLADWNGLAIAALARAAAVFRRDDWLERAVSVFDAVMGVLGAADGRVNHAWRLGRVTAAGLIEDQASMARAALALYEATGRAERLKQAVHLADVALAHFGDGEGGFYATADDADDVPIARPRSAGDHASPSGNGMMAEVFARLWHLTGEPAWRARCEAVLRAFAGRPEQFPTMPGLLAAADLLEAGASVVVAGPPGSFMAQRLALAARAAPDPAVILLRAENTAALPTGHPAQGKAPGPSGAAAFVCRAGVCGLPLGEPEPLTTTLRSRVIALMAQD